VEHLLLGGGGGRKACGLCQSAESTHFLITRPGALCRTPKPAFWPFVMSKKSFFTEPASVVYWTLVKRQSLIQRTTICRGDLTIDDQPVNYWKALTGYAFQASTAGCPIVTLPIAMCGTLPTSAHSFRSSSTSSSLFICLDAHPPPLPPLPPFHPPPTHPHYPQNFNIPGDVPVGVQVIGRAWCDEELLEVVNLQSRLPSADETRELQHRTARPERFFSWFHP
jgi:hypothetical protein